MSDIPTTKISPTRIVKRIEPGMNREEVVATVYQMRNFYRQFGDGFFSSLDVMNYIQHHQIAKWAKPGANVLDLCCGRGLMLPLLRYLQPKIASYTGVDIEPGNARFMEKRVTDGKPIDREYYPFPVRYVDANVADLDTHLDPASMDFLIYTSSIEHMHPTYGEKSLAAARAVATPGATLVLTCPRTPEDQDGYDTQYRAHVYEWKLSELRAALDRTGWRVIREYGLLAAPGDILAAAERVGLANVVNQLRTTIPNEWLTPILSPLFPEVAKEVGIIARTAPTPGG